MLHLWDYLDARLKPEATASLRAHIDECDECSDYVAFQTRFFDAMAALRSRRSAPWHVKARVLDLLASDGYSSR